MGSGTTSSPAVADRAAEFDEKRMIDGMIRLYHDVLGR